MKGVFTNAKNLFLSDFETKNNDFTAILAKCGILALTIFLSCFLPFFVYIAFVFAVIFAVTQLNGRAIYYLVFLMPLMGVFKKNGQSTYMLAYLLCIVLLMLAIRLVIEVFVKKTKKINWWFSIFFAITLIYFMVPFTFPDFSISFSLILGLCLVFCAYYYKEDLNAKELGLLFVLGVCSSIFIGLFYPVSSRLQSMIEIFYAYGLKRFSGAYTNPNILAGEMMFALGIVYTLMINKQIKTIQYPLILIFTISLIYSMSKSGLIIFATETFIFVVLYLIKNHKWQDFVKVASVLIFVGGALLIFNERLRVSFGRITAAITPGVEEGGGVIESPTINMEELTTGRSTIWAGYIDAIFDSVKSALFGYGVGAPYLGEYVGITDWCPHNTYLQCLYFVGFFGVLLMFAMLVSSNGIKKVKDVNWFNVLPIIACAMYLFAAEFFSFRLAIYLIVALFLLVDKEKAAQEHLTSNTECLKIPKKIHYIWLGGNPLPRITEKCISSWKKYCPDYEIIRWDESNLNIDCCEYCRQAYDAKKYAFASDVLRFEVLSKEGGIYLDTDVELLKPIDELLQNNCFMGFETQDKIAPGLILGSVSNCKTIEDIYELYKNDKFIKEDGSLNLTTICTRTTEYLLDKGLVLDNSKQVIDEVTIFPTEYFCPLSPITNKRNITENTYAIHWYYSSWYNKKAKIKKTMKKIANFITNGWFGIILVMLRTKLNNV